MQVKRSLGLALVALVAPLMTLLSATDSASASPVVSTATASPCHGYVYDLWKNQATNKVKMTYSVYCDRNVDAIHVHAFLREGDRWAYTAAVTCTNTYTCSGTTGLADLAGAQTYTARAVEGGDLADVTYVKDGSNNLWGCGGLWGDPMTCSGAGQAF